MSIADDRPTVKDLHNHVVEGVASKWRDFGVQLINPANECVFDIIEEDNPKNAKACCQSMLRKWLATDSGATWNHILNTLRSPCIQLNYLADEIECKLKKETCKANLCISARWYRILLYYLQLYITNQCEYMSTILYFTAMASTMKTCV